LARKHLGSQWMPALFALAYLLYAPVQWLALDEFHPVALACPLLLYAVWYLDEERLLAALPFLGLAALTKEEIPLVVAGLGVWYALARGHRLAGTGIAVAGTALTVVYLTVVMPHYRAGDMPAFYDRFDAVGGSPGGIAKTLFHRPGRSARAAPRAATSYLLVALPLAGLFLAAAPSSPRRSSRKSPLQDHTQTSIEFHYGADVPPRRQRRAGRLACGSHQSRLPPPLPAPWCRAAVGRRAVPERMSAHRVAARAVGLVPPDAPVSTNGLGAPA
jgi:hypothetical protein